MPEAEPTTEETPTLAAELRVLLGKLVRRLRSEAGSTDLTWPQKRALSQLEAGPASVSDLARKDGIRPQSMGAIVAGLEAAGLVAGTPDPHDGRRTLLAMTPACRDMLETGRAAREDWLLQTLEARLSAAERGELAATLRLLARLVD